MRTRSTSARRGSRPGSESAATRNGVSRRTFVRGVVAASVVAGLPASSVLGFEHISSRGRPGSRVKLLTAILNRIIPADARMPAAGDLGVGSFLDEATAANGRLRRQVDRVIGSCRRQSGAARSDRAIDAALQRLERDRPADFDLFIQAVYAGYYTHPRVVEALGRS